MYVVIKLTKLKNRSLIAGVDYERVVQGNFEEWWNCCVTVMVDTQLCIYENPVHQKEWPLLCVNLKNKF